MHCGKLSNICALYMRYTVHEIERALACLRMFVISWSHLEHGLD